MKAAKTWCLAGLILVAGFTSVSCGKDEGTGGGGGRGTVIGGGTGGNGTGGLTGRSGSSNDGGTGDDGPSETTKLGRACVSARDCVDPAAPGLTCVTSKDTVLANGAPPKGLCTTTCTMPTEENRVDTCAALGSNGLCVPFDEDSNEGYCVEGCSFGMPEIGESKCHSRPEFTCNPALFGDTKEPCVSDADCTGGDFCGNTDTCIAVYTACMPGCRSDLDCDAGLYCDQSFFTGTCVAKKPTGKELGAPCTVPAAAEPDEPDECIGFCQPDTTGSTQGHCTTNCGLGRECSWNAATEKFDGLCLYASGLTAETGFIGDFGFCTPSCNCSDDCNNPDLACTLLSNGPLTSAFRGAGLCFAPDAMTEEYNQCTGAGGAGGAGAGGDGAGGANVSGAANGGDGSGGVPAGGAGG